MYKMSVLRVDLTTNMAAIKPIYWNLVESSYGRFSIKFPQRKMRRERRAQSVILILLHNFKYEDLRIDDWKPSPVGWAYNCFIIRNSLSEIWKIWLLFAKCWVLPLVEPHSYYNSRRNTCEIRTNCVAAHWASAHWAYFEVDVYLNWISQEFHSKKYCHSIYFH